MTGLRIAFVLAALLIVAADAVLFLRAKAFSDDLEARVAREHADGARREIVEREERRSWREYSPYYVPPDAVAAQIVLVRSPLAPLERGVRARFSLEAVAHVLTESKVGAALRIRSPWFIDGASEADADDPDAEEKMRRLERILRLEPAVRAAIAASKDLQGATGPQRDLATVEVLRCQAEIASAAADIAEAQGGNKAVQERLRNDWNVAQSANISYRAQQLDNGNSNFANSGGAGQSPSSGGANPIFSNSLNRRGRLGEQIDQQRGANPAQQQAASPPQQRPPDASPPVPPPAEVPAYAPPAYEVHVTPFQPIAVVDPAGGCRATLLVRKVEFPREQHAGSAVIFLPPAGPHYQLFEVDEAEIALPAPSSAWSSRATTLGLLAGAAGLIFVLGTAGLLAVYATVTSRLELARRRTEFAAAVSHELKAPLAGIRALAELMHEGMVASPAKVKEYVANILHESERLSRLIGNVLDAARLERRERTYAVAPGDPAPALREAIEIFRPHLLGRGFAFEVDVPDALPPVLLDRDALVQALANLIDNAAKYTAPCPVRRIAVRAAARGKAVAIEVEDSGIGIEPADRARIFEPFRRGRDPLARGTGGAGLGLPIAKSHVEAMGGRIEVDAARAPAGEAASGGQAASGRPGSVFRIVLPGG